MATYPEYRLQEQDVEERKGSEVTSALEEAAYAFYFMEEGM